MILSIKVYGMACQGCENRIEHALLSLDKITRVNADRNRENVILESENEIDLSAVRQALDDLGFEVGEETFL